MSTAYKLFNQTQLATAYQEVIQPFWQSQVEQGQFLGKDQVQLAYAFVLHPKPLGTIVISSGRIESYLKYKEVVYDLYQNGYSVFIHDHRGQGLSARLQPNKHMGYVADFADYVADFFIFMQQIVNPKTQHKPRLLCHSMGGAIGALTVLKYPDLFEKAVFSAPMFGIRPVLPKWLTTLLLTFHTKINSQVAYFFGQKDYENQAFTSNELTHSEVRYEFFRHEYQQQPELQLGGVTADWLKAAVVAMDTIEQQAQDFPIPALVIQAGADKIVDNKRQGRVAQKMQNTQTIVIDGAKHELLAETDNYRNLCMHTLLDFFAARPV
ncbi:alpha/beta fold hydrolase [Paraglaciecola aestuariivivens]